MISFPNCKINLGLRVLGKRSDGYHEIESVFYPVGWCDAVEMVAAKEFSFRTAGIAVDGKWEKNLCVKAWKLLQKEHNLSPVEMMLLKNIPPGSGLGGGSADAAFTLKTLDKFFQLQLDEKKLMAYAAQLGSDVSFFMENQPMLVTGRGEMHSKTSCSLKGYFVKIVVPEFAVSTSWAYNALDESRFKGYVGTEVPVEEIIRMPVKEWKKYLVNDFEEVVFRVHPSLNEIKQEVYDAGALYCSMSGSGSAVYGLYDFEPEKQSSNRADRVFVSALK